MKSKSFPVAVLTVACVIRSLAAELSLPDATRKVFEATKDSVVFVSVVAKVSVTSSDSKSPVNIPDQELKRESLGTIIDPAGLVVASLSTLDPSREISGREVNTANGPVKLDASVTMKEVKITLPDGTEVPADLVMKDSDLDLAFLKPKPDSKEAKGATFKAIDLKQSATGHIADDIVTTVRMDDILNRQPGIQGGQIVGLTEKPRVFWRGSGAVPGCPSFAMDGKVLGINVIHSAPGKSTRVLVILPAADVLEIAVQAKNAKPAPAEPAKTETKTAAPAAK